MTVRIMFSRYPVSGQGVVSPPIHHTYGGFGLELLEEAKTELQTAIPASSGQQIAFSQCGINHLRVST
ncbi:UNVERIFIED_CONTAM: hypothetical protein K2H54_073023 [Gekko kuhli]